MSSKRKEKKGIKKRRSGYLDGSDFYEDSDESHAIARRIKYSSTLLKSSITQRKGRELERTRSRPSIRATVIRSPVISDNFSEDDDEDIIDNEEAENMETTHSTHTSHTDSCFRERVKIGRNLIRSKYKAQIVEFKDKVHRILKQVYTYYYNSEKNFKSSANQDKEIKLLSSQINERIINSKEYLILFARVLQENVSIYIKTFKDIIVERAMNKKVKEKYNQIKQAIQSNMNKGKSLDKENKDAKIVNCINEVLEFCNENRNEIASIVSELNKIYSMLMKTSPQLNEIFSVPLGELEANYEVTICMENLHKEEFMNVIIMDDFIKSLINEINNKDIPNFVEIRAIVSSIEEDIKQAPSDMKKLKDLLDKIDTKNQNEDLSKLNTAESVHEYLIAKSKNNPRLGNCVNANCKCEKKGKGLDFSSYIDPFKIIYSTQDLTASGNSKTARSNSNHTSSLCGNKLGISNGASNTTTNTTNKNPNSNLNPNLNSNNNLLTPPNISKFKINTSPSESVINSHKNIDELYEYIIADDKKKPEKNPNKKSKGNTGNKKNKNSTNNTNGAANSNSNTVNPHEIEKEIEEFSKKIKTETVHASTIRKVRPKFTPEWVQLITKL